MYQSVIQLQITAETSRVSLLRTLTLIHRQDLPERAMVGFT